MTKETKDIKETIAKEARIETKEEKIARVRKTRNLVQKGPLGMDLSELKPNTRYHVVKDENVYRAEQAGWEICRDDIHVGDSGLIAGSQGLSQVNLKGGIRGVLMEMDEDVYQALEQDRDKDNKRLEKVALSGLGEAAESDKK
jgi:hypothetical protein